MNRPLLFCWWFFSRLFMWVAGSGLFIVGLIWCVIHAQWVFWVVLISIVIGAAIHDYSDLIADGFREYEEKRKRDGKDAQASSNGW